MGDGCITSASWSTRAAFAVSGGYVLLGGRLGGSDPQVVAFPAKRADQGQAVGRDFPIKARIAAGKFGVERPEETHRCGPLMEEWMAALSNRNAQDDRSRVRRHLLPVFADLTLKAVTLPVVMRWIDRMRADGKLAPASMRHCLNQLSRFFSWAIERGYASLNPVKQIPTGKRPQQPHKRDTPWLDDDAIVRRIIHALPEPVGLMFYLGNRSGLRTGELAGLRMADLDGLAEGAVRVRFSYAGPLKEDKAGIGKVKWAPAPDDAPAFLGPWLAQRRAQGAGPEDFVFPCANRGASHYRKEYIEGCWERVAKSLSLSLTWYQATRHSFVTRSLAGGATLDEVSSAVGHSSPVVTRRYYDHHVRRSFSPTLRNGLGLGAPQTAAPIIPLNRRATG
jgi:integrase